MNTSKHARIYEAVRQERDRLYAILDDDPQKAIAAARRLSPKQDLSEANIVGIKASIFIDGGDQLADGELVSEGINLLKRSGQSALPDHSYNIANGLHALAKIRKDGSTGQLNTADLRQEARHRYQHAAENSEVGRIKSSAFTNQANLLKDSYRWVEAYDAYVSALKNDPMNAVALSGISNLIQWRLKFGAENGSSLRRVAIRYLVRARDCLKEAQQYAGLRGVRRIEELMRDFQVDDAVEPEPETQSIDPYAAFVRRHRLALCLAPESLGGAPRRWDHLSIRSVHQKNDSGDQVPTIFAAWNILKSDFLAARWLAYVAIDKGIPETGSYTDTLDYASYGSEYSALTLAQKAACDLLDKIANAASDYLELPGDPQNIYFGNRWHITERKGRKFASPLKWQPEIEEQIKAGNNNFVALAELAQDYAAGYLQSKKQLRNVTTHRFVVLHEMLIDKGVGLSGAVEHYTTSEFTKYVIETLQTVRAALLYFHGAISYHERRLGRGTAGVVLQGNLPSYHAIRDSDNDTV